MSKFKIKMKLTGFELEIEGSKDDVPNIQQALSQQLSGLLQPPAGLIEETPRPQMKTIEVEPAVAPTGRNARPRKRPTSSATPKSNGAESEVALDNWPRDVSNYCSPAQGWSTREKALWVLYVAHKEGIAPEISTSQIRETFNLHYRQAKTIDTSNINRDLGRVKGKLVGEDVRKSPPAWFLTETGIAAVEKKIDELKQSGTK
jgi:hypothetical protein